jgi:CRP/FNR family transcriptional regulator
MATTAKSKNAKIINLLRYIPFFEGLSEKEFSDLKHIFVERNYARSKTILLEEDTLNYMYIILSGKVKVVHSGMDGKEHIVAIHKKGDFFGEMALLDGKTSPATVVALEDTLIAIISKTDFEKYLLKANCVYPLFPAARSLDDDQGPEPAQCRRQGKSGN